MVKFPSSFIPLLLLFSPLARAADGPSVGEIRVAPGFRLPSFGSCGPESDPAPDLAPVPQPVVSAATQINHLFDNGEEPDLEFCAQWSPEFPYNGHHCCTPPPAKRRRRGGMKCLQERRKLSFCDEMTDEQRAYIAEVSSGKSQDLLTRISYEMGREGEQSYCSVNNGFLVHGRPVVPTPLNRIQLRSDRCTNFGTDGMAGMIEWLGHKISAQYADPDYSGLRLLIGDISTPRGGCLSGVNGVVGHASHTAGLDADIGYLTPLKGRPSPAAFHTGFDAKTNWWMIKQIFHNPFACVRVIFLDRHWISKLARVASKDPEWLLYRRFIRHIRGHRNHMHVRIGEGPGPLGCAANPKPELEQQGDDDTEAPAGAVDAVDVLEEGD